MNLSNQLYVEVIIREPLDQEEWMRKVAKVLFPNSGGDENEDKKSSRRIPRYE